MSRSALLARSILYCATSALWEYCGAMRGKTNSKPSTNNTGIVRLENFVDAPWPRSSPTALHASATSSANAGRPGSTYVIRMFPANVKKTGDASIHNQRYERHPSSSAVRDSIPLRRIFQSMPSQTTHQGSVAATAMGQIEPRGRACVVPNMSPFQPASV